MIELHDDNLVFTFPEVHPAARLSVGFQRTLRIPDDDQTYPLPPGLGEFPLRHVDDCGDRVPARWLAHGGVMLPMYQSEALWLSFHAGYVEDRGVEYPFAIKVVSSRQLPKGVGHRRPVLQRRSQRGRRAGGRRPELHVHRRHRDPLFPQRARVHRRRLPLGLRDSPQWQQLSHLQGVCRRLHRPVHRPRHLEPGRSGDVPVDHLPQRRPVLRGGSHVPDQPMLQRPGWLLYQLQHPIGGLHASGRRWRRGGSLLLRPALRSLRTGAPPGPPRPGLHRPPSSRWSTGQVTRSWRHFGQREGRVKRRRSSKT